MHEPGSNCFPTFTANQCRTLKSSVCALGRALKVAKLNCEVSQVMFMRNQVSRNLRFSSVYGSPREGGRISQYQVLNFQNRFRSPSVRVAPVASVHSESWGAVACAVVLISILICV